MLREYDGSRGVPELLEEASGHAAEDSEKTEDRRTTERF